MGGLNDARRDDVKEGPLGWEMFLRLLDGELTMSRFIKGYSRLRGYSHPYDAVEEKVVSLRPLDMSHRW